MTIQEINKIIEEYPVNSTLDQSVKDLLETIAKRAYEAGQVDGENMMTKMIEKVSENI